jgi:hypothetical protein
MRVWTDAPKKTEAVYQVLVRCAAEMRTVTYREIADEVGLAAVGLAFPLGYIRDKICIDKGLPWLNVLAVNKEERRPGHGFLPAEVQLDDQSQEWLWRGMVLQVFSFNWADVVLDK